MIAIPAGLLVGLIGWLLAGGASARAKQVAPVEAELVALDVRVPPFTAGSGGPDLARLVDAPLFALTTGPKAVHDPAVRLEGLSLSRNRRAALIAIDDKPADWLSVGETRDGVVLRAVSPDGVVVETIIGEREVALAPAATDPGAAGGKDVVASDRPPPGMRLPPSPAGAGRGP